MSKSEIFQGGATSPCAVIRKLATIMKLSVGSGCRCFGSTKVKVKVFDPGADGSRLQPSSCRAMNPGYGNGVSPIHSPVSPGLG